MGNGHALTSWSSPNFLCLLSLLKMVWWLSDSSQHIWNPHNTDQRYLVAHPESLLRALIRKSYLFVWLFSPGEFLCVFAPLPFSIRGPCVVTAGTRAPPCQPPFSEERLVFLEFHSFHFLPCLLCEKVKRSSIFLSNWVLWRHKISASDNGTVRKLKSEYIKW